MKDELKAGVRSQADTIRAELRSSETGQDVKIRRTIKTHGLREHSQDLGQPLAIPDGMSPIHGRRDHVIPVGIIETDLKKHGSQVLKQRVDAMGHDRGTLSRRDEAGQAGHNAHICHGLDLTKSLDEDFRGATRQNLSTLHHGMSTTVSFVDVRTQVRICHKGKGPSRKWNISVGLGHHESF